MVAQWLVIERATDDRWVASSNPTLYHGQVRLPHIARCLSDETLYAIGPFHDFHLVYMQGKLKIPQRW